MSFTREDTARQRDLDIATARMSHEALLKHLDGIPAAVVKLHAPMEMSWGASCEGCDYQGWEGEPPTWPCRTVRLVKAQAKRERAAAKREEPAGPPSQAGEQR